jgi:hypothetical protein
LVQWVKIAYNKSASVKLGIFDGLALPRPATRPRPPDGKIDYSFSWAGGKPSVAKAAAKTGVGDTTDDLRSEIRQLILEELRTMQLERR